MKILNSLKYYLNEYRLKKFFQIMGVRPYHVFVPAFFSLAISVFDGISLALLIPITKGIAYNDFSFVSDLPILKNILPVFPSFFNAVMSTHRSILIFLVLIMFSSAVIKNVLRYFRDLMTTYWNGKFQKNINVFIFNRYLSFGKLFLDRTNQGYLTSILSFALTPIKMLSAFQNLILASLTLGVYFYIMIRISWKLTIITLIAFPVLHYSIKWMSKYLQEISRLSANTNASLNKTAFNILSCVPLVNLYSKENETRQLYVDIKEQLRILEMRQAKLSGLIAPIREIIILTTLLSMVVLVTFVLARKDPAMISTFMVFFYVAKMALPRFSIFTDFKILLARSKPKLKKVAEILDDHDKFFIPDGAVEFKGLEKDITFAKLNFSYIDDVQVLHDISLTIKKGQLTAIVGPSGAGKTTLINLLLRFYDVAPSSIFIDGNDIRDFTLSSLREHMALVGQDTLLFNDTIRANITYGLEGVSEDEIMDVVKKSYLQDFIENLPDKLDTYIGDRGIKLSGGEKQRVSIARALLKRSDILLLDEATSSLDTMTEQMIQLAIDEAVKDRTAIVVAHRLSTIKHADKIVVIEDGRVVEQGPLNKLLDKKGRFFEYWEAQKFY